MQYDLDMVRGNTVIHVVRLSDGSFRGEDIYTSGNKPLVFRNFPHLRSFAAKYGYRLCSPENT